MRFGAPVLPPDLRERWMDAKYVVAVENENGPRVIQVGKCAGGVLQVGARGADGQLWWKPG